MDQRILSSARLFLSALLLLTLLPSTRAHDPQLSGIRILCQDSGAVVTITTHLSRLAHAEGHATDTMPPALIEQRLRKRLRVRFDGAEFVPESAHPIIDRSNDLLIWQSIYTRPVRTVEVQSRLYPEDPTSRTVVSIVRDGTLLQEALLDAGHPDLLARQSTPPTPVAVAARYLREGILHIFGGPDHILFILGLLLLGGSLRTLVRTVTAFTLAHSITLSVAATGFWNPSPRIVEPLIALSICVVAIENLRPARKSDLRPYLAFTFGLIHGFGFAGALAEVGLPKDALWVALGAFNIGVEMGQVTIVLLIAPWLTFLAAKRPLLHGRLIASCSLLIASAGAYWFVTRLLG